MTALKIERAVLAGHSWGGNVAVQYAADHPDRVSSLILIDGGWLQVGQPHRIPPGAERVLQFTVDQHGHFGNLFRLQNGVRPLGQAARANGEHHVAIKAAGIKGDRKSVV